MCPASRVDRIDGEADLGPGQTLAAALGFYPQPRAADPMTMARTSRLQCHVLNAQYR